MSALAFCVSDWVWCTSAPDLQCAGGVEARNTLAPVLELPPAERRRLNPLTSFALAAGERLVGGRPRDLLKATPLVFGSSDGDGTVLLRLLSALRGHQPVSPTQFHNSVHNAPAGYWSIGLGSQAPTTALAACDDTVEVALAEAGLQAVTRGGPVIMVATNQKFPPELERARPDLQDFTLAAWCEPADIGVGWHCVVSSGAQQRPTDDGSLEAAVRARGADGLVGSRAVRHLAAVLTIARVKP
jgi:hypothetical protein